MIKVTGKVTGVEKVIRAIGQEKSKTGRTIAESLRKCAEVILKKSQGYCPVKTGALKKTGRIEVTGSGMGTRAAVQYGGPEAPYALYVHENLEARHASPTSAQWITRAVRETRGTCASITRRELEVS